MPSCRRRLRHTSSQYQRLNSKGDYLTVSSAPTSARSGHRWGMSSFEQIKIEASEKPAASAAPGVTGRFEVAESAGYISVFTSECEYRFDRESGLISSIVYNGNSLISSPVAPTVWRAPTDNDRRIKNDWIKSGYHLAKSHCRAFSLVSNDGKSAVIEADMVMGAPPYRPFLKMKVIYTVRAEGWVEIAVDARKTPLVRMRIIPLPRLRFEFRCRRQQLLRYFGMSPMKASPTSALLRMGEYETTVTEH